MFDVLRELINKDSKKEENKDPEPVSKCTAPSIYYDPFEN